MARWIGNLRMLEVHDFWSTRTPCRIRDIAPKDRLEFDTIFEAREAGLLHCPWCIGDTPEDLLEMSDVAGSPIAPLETLGSGSHAA